MFEDGFKNLCGRQDEALRTNALAAPVVVVHEGRHYYDAATVGAAFFGGIILGAVALGAILLVTA